MTKTTKKPDIKTPEAGQPLRLHELNIQELTRTLYELGIRWKNGKKIGELVYDDGGKEFVGLHKGQIEVVESPARFKVVSFGRRTGKTAVAALIAIAAFFQPRRRIWIVGPEYSHVEKVFQELYSILVNQMKVIGKGVKNSAARKAKGDYYLESPWESIIEGKSGTNPDSMAGEAVDLVIFDEAGLEPNLMEIWQQMLRPTLSDKRGSAIFISTPRGKNSYYELFKLGQRGKRQRLGYEAVKKNTDDFTSWDSWSMPTYTNPFIPEEEYHEAKKIALQSGTYTLFKQEYDADFESVSDAAFEEFKADIPSKDDPKVRTPYHVVDYKFDRSYGPWFGACDYNIAKPACSIYAQLDPNNNIVIFDELFRPSTTAYMQAEFFLDKAKELGVMYSAIIGDVSGSFQKSAGNEFTQMAEVLGHMPVGIKQSREAGTNLIKEWLAYPLFDAYGNILYDENHNPQTTPRLFVASHCIETIKALETAKKKLGKDGSIKQDYHEFKDGREGILDALRYLMVYLFAEKQHVQLTKGIY